MAIENGEVAVADVAEEMRSFLPTKSFHMMNQPLTKLFAGASVREMLKDFGELFLRRKQVLRFCLVEADVEFLLMKQRLRIHCRMEQITFTQETYRLARVHRAGLRRQQAVDELVEIFRARYIPKVCQTIVDLRLP